MLIRVFAEGGLLHRGSLVLLMGTLLLLQSLALTATVTASTSTVGLAGYQITGPQGSMPRIRGSWVVPTLSCSTNPNSNSTISVMLDGLNGLTDRMQIGTIAACVGGTPTYRAFVDMLPAKGKVVEPTLTIKAGDIIEAQGKWSPQTHGWHAQIIDETTHVTSIGFAKAPSSFNPPLSSGSFAIATASNSPLSDFGSLGFGKTYTGVARTCILTAVLANKTTVSIITIGSLANQQGFTLHQINMVDSGSSTMATTSALKSDGESFTVSWIAAS